MLSRRSRDALRSSPRSSVLHGTSPGVNQFWLIGGKNCHVTHHVIAFSLKSATNVTVVRLCWFAGANASFPSTETLTWHPSEYCGMVTWFWSRVSTLLCITKSHQMLGTTLAVSPNPTPTQPLSYTWSITSNTAGPDSWLRQVLSHQCESVRETEITWVVRDYFSRATFLQDAKPYNAHS